MINRITSKTKIYFLQAGVSHFFKTMSVSNFNDATKVPDEFLFDYVTAA